MVGATVAMVIILGSRATDNDFRFDFGDLRRSELRFGNPPKYELRGNCADVYGLLLECR